MYFTTYTKGKRTLSKRVVGIKNPQLGHILSSEGIPWVNLEVFDCPSMSKLDEIYGEYWCCRHHNWMPWSKFRCAYRKCLYMWRWLNQIKSKKLNSIYMSDYVPVKNDSYDEVDYN